MTARATTGSPRKPATALQVPALAVGILLMVGGTVYPRLMADGQGRADHLLASLLLWAMSAGFVRGVGFVPRRRVARALLSGWACGLALLAALCWRIAH